MKHLIIAITLLSGTLLAQSGPATVFPAVSSTANGPSYSQMYCSGFITRAPIPRTNFVLASKESPHEDRYAAHSQLFLGGPALVEGQRYSILRQVSDPNREDSSPLQRKKLAKLGALYQEVGWVTVHSVTKGASLASFDFSCDATTPGDIVVPFKEKPTLFLRTTDGPINTFMDSPAAQSPHAARGQILGSKEFIGLLGTGNVVYTDFGTAKGIKAGDYLFIMRGYSPEDLNKIDRASEGLPKGTEATSVNPAKIKPEEEARVPQHILGEALVLDATPEASTAMITRAFAEVELGDTVQGEDGQTAVPGSDSTTCQPASRIHRMLLLHHHACN